jgi:SAM-dependent methyltransferase
MPLPDAPVQPPYSALSEVYDAIMQDVPYDEWCDFVLLQLALRGWSGKRVLDLGCGTGRAGTHYRDRGYAVLGVDPSAAMIAAARRRDPGGSYLVGDARTLALGVRFDLVIAVFDALNNLTGDDELGRACRRAARHLRPGGAFVFDVNTSVGLADLWEDDVAEGWAGDVYYRWEHSWDPLVRRARVAAYCRGPSGAFVEHHEERPFDPPELDDALRAAGFGSVEVITFPTGRPATEDDPRVWAVALTPAATSRGRLAPVRRGRWRSRPRRRGRV